MSRHLNSFSRALWNNVWMLRSKMISHAAEIWADDLFSLVTNPVTRHKSLQFRHEKFKWWELGGGLRDHWCVWEESGIFQSFFKGDKAPWSLGEGWKGLWSVWEMSVEQTCQLKEDRVSTDGEVKKRLLEMMGLRDIPDL